MNNPKAMMVLGRLYEEGIGTKKDTSKALAYYEYASQHEPYAIYKIGTFLEEGIHPECIDGQPNRELAFSSFREAQNQGDFEQESAFKEASFKVGQYYQFGYGVVEKNLNAARRHYESAAADGHIESMNALGSLFFNENEFRDYEQAAAWFKKAADRGYNRGICNLGICYELGVGVEKDWNQAFVLYQESADKGFIQAIYNHGFLSFRSAMQNTHSANRRNNPQFAKAAD